jgi:hypothetical protein
MIWKEEVEYKVGDIVEVHNYNDDLEEGVVIAIGASNAENKRHYWSNHMKKVENKSTQSEISAKRIIEVTIKKEVFQLTYKEACNLHKALEEAGV